MMLSLVDRRHDMAAIEKRKTNDGQVRYRVKIRLKGKPPQTETFHRLADAKRWAHETEVAIREDRYFKTVEAKKHTVGDLIDRYILDVMPLKKKSQKKQTAQLLWWKGQIGCFTLAELTPALIGEKRDELLRGVTCRGSKRSPATVMRYLSALSHACTVATKEWGWLDDSPMRKVTKLREARGRVRFLDENERAQLLQACKESQNPHLYPVVLLAMSTGMRYGEIINLTWRDVDISRRRIILQETKNGDRRAVPLAGQALELLARLEKEHSGETDLLFPKLRKVATISTPSSIISEHGVTKVQKVQKPAQLRIAWQTAVKKAELKDFRFHDLRHTAASYLAMSGASLAEIAEILGHKTLAMVKRYSHLSDTHKHSVIDRMNKNFLEE
jgi:integrase